MKTNMEKQYEKLIIYYICSLEMTTDHRVSMLYDFHEHSREYYDNLCDILYDISTGSLHAPLWLTKFGLVYASTHGVRKDDIKIMEYSAVPAFEGDLVPQLERVFLHIYKKTGLVDKIIQLQTVATL